MARDSGIDRIAAGTGVDGAPAAKTIRRPGVALWLALPILAAAARIEGAGGTWQQTVTPRNAAFPRVEIELGYPGGYIPTSNSPITLRARGGSRPFDGYIGFRYVAGRARTYDVPVASRAQVGTGGRWSFDTTTQLADRRIAAVDSVGRPGEHLLRRELLIEWRNRNLEVISSARAGLPPWSVPRPLRIARPGESLHSSILGASPVVIAPENLSQRAQWYAGFTALVTPVATWLDLPIVTRNAILSSGVSVVFFGVPRPGQAMTQTDKLLLPVEFLASPGFYQIPRPYRSAESGGRTMTSWRPRSGTVFTGAPLNPFFVEGAGSWYAAEERALTRPLPALRADALPAWEKGDATPWFSYAFRSVQQSSRLLAFLAVAAICTGLWLVTTRGRAVRGIVIAAVLACVTFVSGRALRPPNGGTITEWWRLTPLGVANHGVREDSYGESPLGPMLEMDDAATWTARLLLSNAPVDVEVRDSETLPEFGMRHGEDPWLSAERFRHRREPSPAVDVQITRADERGLSLRWQAPMSVQYVLASWYARGRLHVGGARVPGGLVGSVTIPHAGPRILDFEQSISAYEIQSSTRFRVLLRSREGNLTRQIVWSDWEPADSHRTAIFGRVRASMPDVMRGIFMIPRGGTPGNEEVVLRAELPPGAVKSIRLDGPRGMIEGQRAQGPGVFRVGGEELASIAGPGDLVVMEVLVDPQETGTEVPASMVVTRTRK